MLERAALLDKRFRELEQLMANPSVVTDFVRLAGLAKERASLERVVTLYEEYCETLKGVEEAKAIIQERGDHDLAALAREEIITLEERQLILKEELTIALIPEDPQDERDIIVEIRAAAGGEEAALFAGDLYRMYTRYSLLQGWGVELIDAHNTGIGGFKEIIFEVKGQKAYSRLKHESGVHRVQRVPTTESSGRLHTSTVTVAVLPEADEVEINLKEEDLRIDVFHAGGHGGQNVNKVATAVRITHLPSSIVAMCQDERSQLRNKQKAMAVLRARLLDKATQEQRQEISQDRRSQVGTGVRAEKARTYNYPQNRVTDHRIGLTMHNLEAVLDGNLDSLIDPLRAMDQATRLKNVTG